MMNPYAVLGVPENASEAQIKDAYRALARKYQDDTLQGGPLADIARQKMAELDAAYDAAVGALRGQAPSGRADYTYTDYSGTQGNYNSGGANTGASQFADIRARMNSGRMDDAEMLLDGIPREQRSAEWFFLKGVIQQRRGWFDEAYTNLSTACQMDPQNREYAAAFNNLNNNARGGYRQTRGGGCSACEICEALWCADCCCECMGGDLIPGC